MIELIYLLPHMFDSRSLIVKLLSDFFFMMSTYNFIKFIFQI